MKLEHITVFVVAMAMGTTAYTVQVFPSNSRQFLPRGSVATQDLPSEIPENNNCRQTIFAENLQLFVNDDKIGHETRKNNNAGVSSNLCDSGTVDAAFSDTHYSYIIRGNYFWKMDVTESVLEQGIFDEVWGSAPSFVDAAVFEPATKSIFFFSGEKYWKYSESKVLQKGYPKLISEGFPGVPNDMNAAIIWPSDNKFYFFKGSKYWRRDYELKVSGSDSGPLSISGKGNWPGMPPSIDAIFIYKNGIVYFFKDDMYYRYDRSNNEVLRSDPAFPRLTLDFWFKCH